MPTNRRRISRKTKKTPDWQLEYLKTGHIKTDAIFEGLPETKWPDLHPNPWEAFYFKYIQKERHAD
jgi:hypothetical protein